MIVQPGGGNLFEWFLVGPFPVTYGKWFEDGNCCDVFHLTWTAKGIGVPVLMGNGRFLVVWKVLLRRRVVEIPELCRC